jgi:hypothetical protein
MDAKTSPKAGTAASIAGAWLVVIVVHGRAGAQFVTSIRCNAQSTADEVAGFLGQCSELGVAVLFDPSEAASPDHANVTPLDRA